MAPGRGIPGWRRVLRRPAPVRPEAAPRSASASPLATALAELARLGTDQDRVQLAMLRDRLADIRLRVAVAGEATRGKSTLVNALLGQAVLPAGETPLTTVVTTVRYGQDPHAQVRFLDGHEERHPLGALADLVSEAGNPLNRRNIASVTVYAEAAVLAAGAELVDTPGTGSVLAADDGEAVGQVLDTLDAAVIVLAADPPVSAVERDLLGRIAGRPVTTFVVLNKADHLDAAGLARVTEFTRRVVTETIGRTSQPGGPRLYPMSASAAQQGGDPGFAAFAADFTAYLATRRAADLTQSAIAQARRIALALLGEATAARRAGHSRATETATRAEQFSARLATAAKGTRDGVPVVNGESARLLFALNDAADADVPRLRRSIASQLDVIVDGELSATSPAEIGRLGPDRLASLTRAEVSAWQQRQQASIRQTLSRLDRRLAGDLAAHMETLRDSAAELLGVDLARPDPDGQLARTPWPAGPATEAAGPSGQNLPGPRHAMPGERGRRRARQHLHDQIADLVTTQLDTACTDLRDQLATATRALAAAVERRCADVAGQIQAARRAADDVRQSSVAEARHTEDQLDSRERALRHVLGLLDQAAPDNV
jgi:GTP-binding protein EngB required for normal cell division